jgi:hypothetical protein
VQVDEVLVSSSDVDLTVAALFDSDEVFLRIVSLTSPVSIKSGIPHVCDSGGASSLM